MALGNVFQPPLPFNGGVAAPYQGQLFGNLPVPYAQGNLGDVLSSVGMPMGRAMPATVNGVPMAALNPAQQMLALNPGTGAIPMGTPGAAIPAGTGGWVNPTTQAMQEAAQARMAQMSQSALPAGSQVASNLPATLASVPDPTAIPLGQATAAAPRVETLADAIHVPPPGSSAQSFEGSLFKANGLPSPESMFPQQADNLFGDSLGGAVRSSLAGKLPAPTALAEEGLVGGLRNAATEATLKGRLGALKGGLAESAIPAVGWNMLNNYISNQPDGPGKEIMQGMGVGGQAGAAFGPVGSVVGALGVGAGQASTETPFIKELINGARGFNSDNTLANVANGLNPFAWLAKGVNEVRPDTFGKTNDSFLDVLKGTPLAGPLGLEQGSGSTPATTSDATINNTNVQDRWNKLKAAVAVNDNETTDPAYVKQIDDLKPLYNMMRQTGATDEEAWTAVQQGAISAYQNYQSDKADLGKLASLQAQVKNYMQPYADNTRNRGIAQGKFLQDLSGTLPAAYQGIAQYMAQNAPMQAAQTADSYMQQAMMLPTQAQQQAEAQRKAQFDAMIQQYQLQSQFKDLKASGQLQNPSNPITTTG